MSFSSLANAITQKDLADIARFAAGVAESSPQQLVSALVFAARSNRPEAMGELLKFVDVNARLPKDQRSATALHAAAHAGSKATVERLLALGADPLAATDRGELPLHLAVARSSVAGARNPAAERLEIVRCVLGAAPSAAKAADADGSTPLRLAAARLATTREAFDAQEELLSLLIPLSDVNAKAACLGTPLIAAASAWNGQAVRLLLDAGADPACMDGENQTAIFRALGDSTVSAASPADRLECVRLLAAQMDFSKDDLGAVLLRKSLTLSPAWPEGVGFFAAPEISADAWRAPRQAIHGKIDILGWSALPQDPLLSEGMLAVILKARGLEKAQDATDEERVALCAVFVRVSAVATVASDATSSSGYFHRRDFMDRAGAQVWASLALLSPWAEPGALDQALARARAGMKKRPSASIGDFEREARAQFVAQAEALSIECFLAPASSPDAIARGPRRV